MDEAELAELARTAPAVDTLAAHPLPDGQVLITAGNSGGTPIAAFRVSHDAADRFARGPLAGAVILGRLIEHDPDAPPAPDL